MFTYFDESFQFITDNTENIFLFDFNSAQSCMVVLLFLLAIDFVALKIRPLFTCQRITTKPYLNIDTEYFEAMFTNTF